MPVTDPIADMLAILKNGIRAKKESVIVKRSNITENIMGILKREGFISNFKAIEDNKQGTIKIYLKYDKGECAICDLKRISKPGLRNYVKAEDVKSVYGGIGIALISTSKGVMTDKEAKEKNFGGELLCQVW